MKRELKIGFLDALLLHLPKRNGFIIRNIVKGPAHIDAGKVVVNDALRFVLHVNDEDYSEMTAFMIDEGFAVRVTDGNPWPDTIQLTDEGRKLKKAGCYAEYVNFRFSSWLSSINWSMWGVIIAIIGLVVTLILGCS